MLENFERLAGPVAPGSWGGILLFVGADLEYAARILGLASPTGVEVCAECRASG